MVDVRRPGALEYDENRKAFLRGRCEEAKGLVSAVEDAGEKLRQLTRGRKRLAEMSLRRRFAYRDDPAPGHRSDRRLPPPEERPPAGRIVSAHGIALRLMLLAIFEAQTRTQVGKSPDNQMPLRAGGDEIGWIDLFAVPVRAQGQGKRRASPGDKKVRRLQSALRTLSCDENQLMFLPHGERRSGKYEGFLLNDEGGRRAHADAVRYVVPSLEEKDLFKLPAGLITKGWIHFLTDGELRLLMMIADREAATGNDQVRFSGNLRLLHYTYGYDSYESNLLMERFGLIEVEEQGRHVDGKVVDFENRYTEPHSFRLLRDGFDQYAVDKVIDVLRRL